MNIKYDKSMFEYKRSLSWKSRFVILFAITVFIIIVALAVDFYREKKVNLIDPNESDYYAVFLSNDQVYFGKIVLNDKEEMVLSNVYYVSLNGGSGVNEITQSQFQIVKLGNEIHGPTDKMFINKDQILFYEQLRNDSSVVETIRGMEGN